MTALRRRLKKVVLYGLSRGATDGLLALRGLLLAGLLGPSAFGGWVLFRLATNYCGFAQLGVHSGLEFHVARAPGSEGRSSGVLYWRSALGFVLLVFGGIALATLAASFFVTDVTVALGMRWFAAAVLTEQVWLIGLSYLRARGDLRRYAVYEATNGALQVTFAVVLTPIWGLSGAFASFVLATVVGLALLARSLPLAPALSRVRLRKLLKVGLPIVASLLLGFALASADRLIVAANESMSVLGLYGFAFSVAGIAGSLALVIRVVVYPAVYASVAALGPGPALKAHLEQNVMPFATLLPPVIGLAALMLGPIVALAIPGYVGAVPATRLLVFIGVTAGFERLGALAVVAAGRQRVLPLISAGALVLNVTLCVLALRSGLGLWGFAAAALFSNATFGLATIGIVARLAGMDRPARLVLRAALPLACCALSVAVISAVRPGLGMSGTAVSMGLYLVAILPVLPAALNVMGKIRRSGARPSGAGSPRLARAVRVATILLLLASVSILILLARKSRELPPRGTVVMPSVGAMPQNRTVDLRPDPSIRGLARYVDLSVGDTVEVTRADGKLVEIRVASIEVENSSRSIPRTRVNLEVADRRFVAHCGMSERRRGGLGPTDIDGLGVGVEVTRLLFSDLGNDTGVFNDFEHLRLRNDLRLSIWDRSRGISPGADGRFPVSQPEWTRDRYGGWLHSTRTGIHSAIDIFATNAAAPERVLSPVDGTVYRVYNRDATPDDRTRIMGVNLYGDAVVGPDGEKVLYRLFHFSKVFVSDGQSVSAGQCIGLTGHTGFDPAIGDHLHIEMRLNPSHFGLPRDDDLFATIAVNPYYYLLEWYESGQVRRK